MDPVKLFILVTVLATIILQAKQFDDFQEWRCFVIDGLYVAVIIALMMVTDFFAWT